MQRKGYVYKFIGMDDQIIYVGKTVNMNRRMKQHFSSKSHLAHTDLYKKVQRIEYLICKNEFESLEKELFYINYYKPHYNTASKIKQLIDPPKTKDTWRVYRIIKPMPAKISRHNKRVALWTPLFIIVMFIYVIFTLFSDLW